MTDFIRNILVTAAAANASSAAAAAAAAPAPTPAPVSAPVNQIQIPPPTAAPAAVAPSVPAAAATVEKQRLIKVEVPEPSAPAVATASADAGKAQRAARRDVVNARRDKRKAMASPPTPSSPAGLTSGADLSSTDLEDDAATTTMLPSDETAANASSKKMKTSATSSVAVAGGLAASETASAPTAPATTTAPAKKSSFSSSMPPTPGLLFTPEIDAAGEERLRAMEAQLETLDPDSKEAKKKRRLIRNRMSAQLHRERKKAYVGQLEDQLLEKDRELKLLQEKLAKLMAESEKPATAATTATDSAAATPAVETKPVVATTPATPTTAAVATPVVAATAKPKADDDVVIKEEPQAWDAPSWALGTTDSWDLHGLEDSEMAELETADLLRDFDDPFAGLGGAAYPELGKPHHEIHAAKKNIAMMAAVMFSVSFFGNSPAFYNVTPGSNFSSTFSAHPPKDLSQMSIASRIVACLEKTSWKEFRSVSSWISQAATAAAAAAMSEEEMSEETEERPRAVASPSAASDVTDSAGSSCGSPARSVLDDGLDVAMMGETDLIDEFEYPVEDPFGADAAASADWLEDVEKELPKQDDEAACFLSDVMLHEPVVPKQEPFEVPTTKTPAASETKSLTSRLYESLTALWREKNQVLLTVRDDKQQVLQRSVADMSSIRDGLQSGNLFTKVFGGDDAASQAAAASEDTSVTFLYPMSAFASDSRPFSRAAADGEDADPVFLEVSCQLNGGGAAVPAAAMPAMM